MRRNPECDSCGERNGVGWFDTDPPTWSEPWWMCQECVEVTNKMAEAGEIPGGPLVAKPAPSDR